MIYRCTRAAEVQKIPVSKSNWLESSEDYGESWRGVPGGLLFDVLWNKTKKRPVLDRLFVVHLAVPTGFKPAERNWFSGWLSMYVMILLCHSWCFKNLAGRWVCDWYKCPLVPRKTFIFIVSAANAIFDHNIFQSHLYAPCIMCLVQYKSIKPRRFVISIRGCHTDFVSLDSSYNDGYENPFANLQNRGELFVEDHRLGSALPPCRASGLEDGVRAVQHFAGVAPDRDCASRIADLRI